MTTPTVGHRAPEFSLRDQFGATHTVASLCAEKTTLLVFFPFAFTGTCTSELDEIRDTLDSFDGPAHQVVTISCDPIYSLRAWADQRGYFFPMLSDFWPHGAASTAYGVFDADQGMAVRGTFLIDRDQLVRYSEVLPPGSRRDFDPVRAAVASLSSAE